MALMGGPGVSGGLGVCWDASFSFPLLPLFGRPRSLSDAWGKGVEPSPTLAGQASTNSKREHRASFPRWLPAPTSGTIDAAGEAYSYISTALAPPPRCALA